MNIIDILAGLVLVLCLWSGWRSGILVQLSGIVGIVAGTWVAYRFSHAIGRWLDLEEMPSEALFVIVLLGVLVCVILLCQLITRLLKAGGLAGPLRLLGAVFAVAKECCCWDWRWSRWKRPCRGSPTKQGLPRQNAERGPQL